MLSFPRLAALERGAIPNGAGGVGRADGRLAALERGAIPNREELR